MPLAPVSAVVFQKVREIVPLEYQSRLMALLARVVADAERRYAPKVLSSTPFKPETQRLGIAVINPKDFNIPSLRKAYDTTGWQDSPIKDFTTSKMCFLVIGGYDNREAVPKSIKLQWRVEPITSPPEDIEDLVKQPDHRIGIDPFSIGPETICDLDVNIEAAGYDHLRPIGLVVGEQPYIVSRTWK